MRQRWFSIALVGLLGACASAPPAVEVDYGAELRRVQAARAARQRETEAALARLTCEDLERRHRTPGSLLAGERELSLFADEDTAMLGDGPAPEALLALARFASTCPGPGAALIVFREVPGALWRAGLEPQDIERAYAFLAGARARSLALLGTLLGGDEPALERALGTDNDNTNAFRPEVAIGATCVELDGITPVRGGFQFERTYGMLERHGCQDEQRRLVRRSLASTSAARAAACWRAGPDLLAEVETAAATDPGEGIYETRRSGRRVDGVVASILVSLFLDRSVRVGTTWHGRWACTAAAAALRESATASAR